MLKTPTGEAFYTMESNALLTIFLKKIKNKKGIKQNYIYNIYLGLLTLDIQGKFSNSKDARLYRFDQLFPRKDSKP
jgi:hypothetical protein